MANVKIDLQLPTMVQCVTCRMPMETEDSDELKFCGHCGEWICCHCDNSKMHQDECKGVQ